METAGHRQDRRALRSVALQFWVNGVVIASFVPRFPEIRHQIGVGLAGLGLLLTAGSLGGLAGSGAGSHLIARFGSRRTMTASAAALVALLPLLGLTGSPVSFLAVLLAMHACDAVTDMAMNLQGSWLSARRPVPVMSRLHGLWSVGTLVGGAATSLAASVLSLRAHLVVVAVVLAATLAYVSPGLLRHDEVARAPASSPARAGPGGGSPLRLGVTFALLAVATIALELTLSDWSALRLSDDFGLGAGPAGVGYVALTAGMVVSRLGGDLATARLGPARLARVATVVAATGVGLATLVPVLAVAMAGFGITGLGVGVLFPRLYDQAARAPGRPGMMLGALTAGIRVGIIVIPVAVGALAASRLSVGAAMALIALPGAALLLLARERADLGQHGAGR